MKLAMERASRRTWWRLLALALVVTAVPAEAIPPTWCRQRLVGELRADDGRVMPVIVRARVSSSYGFVEIDGRTRCRRHRDGDCFLPRLRFEGDLERDPDDPWLARLVTARLRGDGAAIVCTLEGRTPYLRDLCVGALGGTFECPAGAGVSSVSGAFGFTVDSCTPCVRPDLKRP